MGKTKLMKETERKGLGVSFGEGKAIPVVQLRSSGASSEEKASLEKVRH